MARRDRSNSPEPYSNKRVRPSHPRSRSPSPTRRRRHEERPRDRYKDDRYRGRDNRDRDRDYRDRDRERDVGRERDDRRRENRDRSRDRSRERKRSRSRERRERDALPPTPPRVQPPPEVRSAKPATVLEDEKVRAKREKLEAWRKAREATGNKSLDQAKAKAMALAGKIGGLPPPGGKLDRSAFGGLGLKGLPVKHDTLKMSATAASMDDSVISVRKLEKLGDMPEVDMSMNENIETVGTNLEGDDDEADVKLNGTMEPSTDVMDVDFDQPATSKSVVEEDEDEDPLDAFMSDVKKEVTRVDLSDHQKGGLHGLRPLDGRMDDEGEDEEEHVPVVDELDTTGLNPEEIMALAAKKARKKDIAVTDHSRIAYEPFRKAFYYPPPEVTEMTDDEAELLRLSLDSIKIRGVDCPRPIVKWSHCGLPTSVLDVIKRLNYEKPSSIQSQAIPAIMSGRDVIGVAKTGSGKTVAFLLPMFRHIKDQRSLEQMEGPVAIIMTPTRELAVQIHRDCKPFLRALNLRAVCAYGGSPIKDQIADMKKGAEIIVCTPGRMIDLLTANSGRVTNLKRVTYLVLDEADRMFDMGFEPQVMKIINNIRPDRQTVLFSATFPKQMDSLARKILAKPLEITVGGRSVVAAEIEQIVEVREEDTKFNRLLEILGQAYDEDPETRSLIFVDRQENADNLLRDLLRRGYLVQSLHGGKEQMDRDQTISDFKAGIVPILTATSVAARGLDVKQLKLVLNYDVPNHMEDYVHRAGRTGRAGNKGTCITFITAEQERYSVDLFRALQASNAIVPKDLEELANTFLEKVRTGTAKVASSGFGGKGLDKLEKEREAKDLAERKAYGEGEDQKVAEAEQVEAQKTEESITNLKVEIRRGPAPDSSKASVTAAAAAALQLVKAKEQERMQKSLQAAEEAAAKAGKDTAAGRQALSVIAKLNAQIRASKLSAAFADAPGKTSASDSNDFHAIIPINDYPQKARWKVTNKETMSNLIDATGASVTNKGIYYAAGQEPSHDGPPKLHLLVESNDDKKVEAAVREIKRLLIEASTAAMQAEARHPTAHAGRYSVL